MVIGKVYFISKGHFPSEGAGNNYLSILGYWRETMTSLNIIPLKNRSKSFYHSKAWVPMLANYAFKKDDNKRYFDVIYFIKLDSS